MTFTLYTSEASFRAFAPLIAAEHCNIDVAVQVGGEENSPTGKLPVLTSDNAGCIFTSAAICNYLAGLRSDNGLLGSSLSEATAISNWVDWSQSALDVPACVWFYPVAGYMPYHKESHEKAKQSIAEALQVLEDSLQDDKSFLVGDSLTLADIFIVSTLLYPFKLVADAAYRKPFPNVERWFTACCAMDAFAQVVGHVTLCEKELPALKQ